MRVSFRNAKLKRVWENPKQTGGMDQDVVSRFRKRVGEIEAADDERTLRQLKSMRLEKLKGDRKGQHSIRLNDQWRLIVEFEGKGQNTTVHFIEVVDYH